MRSGGVNQCYFRSDFFVLVTVIVINFTLFSFQFQLSLTRNMAFPFALSLIDFFVIFSLPLQFMTNSISAVCDIAIKG